MMFNSLRLQRSTNSVESILNRHFSNLLRLKHLLRNSFTLHYLPQVHENFGNSGTVSALSKNDITFFTTYYVNTFEQSWDCILEQKQDTYCGPERKMKTQQINEINENTITIPFLTNVAFTAVAIQDTYRKSMNGIGHDNFISIFDSFVLGISTSFHGEKFGVILIYIICQFDRRNIYHVYFWI